jgi:hypothetical protein
VGRGVVVGVNGIEFGRLTVLVGLGEGDDGSIDRRSLDDIVSDKSGVTEYGESIICAKDGEAGTGSDDGSVESCGEFISTGGISDFAVRDDEVGLGETLLYPTLDVLSALIGVPPVPRDRGDTALEEVALVETEVRNVDESARSVGASFSEGLWACLDENTRPGLNESDGVLVDADDFCESPVVVIVLCLRVVVGVVV